jgi:triosephosphate isomerase
MRKPVIAGNWKMNKTVEETRSLVYELSIGLRDIRNV